MANEDGDTRWALEVTPVAEEDLKRLDAQVRKRALNKIKWIRNHFDDIVPQPLSNAYRGLFKLRMGDWRIVYDVDPEKQLLTVTSLTVEILYTNDSINTAIF
jgi:mRNA interferase RelE/StbE